MTEKKWTPITTDEAGGTLYVLVSDSPTPPGAEIDDGSIAGALAKREAFIAAGAQAISVGERVTTTGLNPQTTYYAHLVHSDDTDK